MNQPGLISLLIDKAVKESNLPKDKIAELTEGMQKYLNSGAPYGESPEGFLRYYIHDLKGESPF